jgi:hypothetical protein
MGGGKGKNPILVPPGNVTPIDQAVVYCCSTGFVLFTIEVSRLFFFFSADKRSITLLQLLDIHYCVQRLCELSSFWDERNLSRPINSKAVCSQKSPLSLKFNLQENSSPLLFFC